MNCDVGKATEGLENECDVGKAMEGLENERTIMAGEHTWYL